MHYKLSRAQMHKSCMLYFCLIFSVRQHICTAQYMLSPVHLSHRWISQKWLKLGSIRINFHKCYHIYFQTHYDDLKYI